MTLNGAELGFTRRPNPYRLGAVEVPLEALLDRIEEGVNRLLIRIG